MVGYFVLVILQTVVLPIVSGVIELATVGGDPVLVFGKWWVFWGVGTRLLVAGIVPIRPAPSTGHPSVQSPMVAPRAAGDGAARGDTQRALVPVEEFGAMVRVLIAGQRRAMARPPR